MSEYAIKPTYHAGHVMTGVVVFEGAPPFGGFLKFMDGTPYVEVALDGEHVEIDAPAGWENMITERIP